MARGALFGRYWEASSPIHRLDPRVKVASTFALVVCVFCAWNFYALGVIALFTAGTIACARIPFSQALRSVAPLSFIIVLTALFNLAYVQGGEVYADWGWLVVSAEGVRQALFVSARLALLLLSGSLLTMTTTSLDITDGLERLLSPLARIGAPAHEFSLVMGTALRFLPQFAEELASIRAAQLTRGAKLATSPVKGGLSGLASLLVPLFASAFRHADTLSAAMEARCYHGASGRTRLNPMRLARRDAVAIAAFAVLFTATLATSMLL